MGKHTLLSTLRRRVLMSDWGFSCTYLQLGSRDATMALPSRAQPFPAESGSGDGTSNGNLILLPVPGFPPSSSTVSVLGTSVIVTLHQNFSQNFDGGVITVTLTGSLTKQ